MGPFHELFTYRRHSDRVQKLASLAGLEPAIKGYKSRMLGAPVFPKVTLVSPQRLISLFIHFGLSRTSRAHSVWFYSLRDVTYFVLLNALSHLLNTTLPSSTL